MPYVLPAHPGHARLTSSGLNGSHNRPRRTAATISEANCFIAVTQGPVYARRADRETGARTRTLIARNDMLVEVKASRAAARLVIAHPISA